MEDVKKAEEAKKVEKTSEEIKKEMLDMFKENEMLQLAESVLENTEVEFIVEDELYRVRQSTFSEKQDANKYRMKKYIELLKDPDCLLEKDLTKLYKDKGVDIANMNKQITEDSKQQQTLMFELGKAIKENRPVPELEKYKNEISKIMARIQEVNAEKQQFLEFSLENRIITEVYSFLIWLTAEKKTDSGWEKIWKTHADFLSQKPNELLFTVTKNGAVLLNEEVSG